MPGCCSAYSCSNRRTIHNRNRGDYFSQQGEAKGRVAATTTTKSEKLTNAVSYPRRSRRWERALQVPDKGVRELPRTQHRLLLLLQQRTLVRARLGQSAGTDMQRFKEEGEHVCSSVWHQVALCSPDTQQQLAGFQSSVASLSEQGAKGRWQKADLLMQFAEWLYGQNQPLQTTQHHLHWAVDLLLQLDPELAQETEKLVPYHGHDTKTRGPKRRSVRRLDGWIRAHTLLGFMEPRTSPGHQENLLRAYVFVLRTWNVSMATVREVLNEMAKAPPVEPPSSAASRKEESVVRDKGKGKKTKEAQQTPLAKVIQKDSLLEMRCSSMSFFRFLPFFVRHVRDFIVVRGGHRFCTAHKDKRFLLDLYYTWQGSGLRLILVEDQDHGVNGTLTDDNVVVAIVSWHLQL
ncbi:unnamed protein product [Gadus morhua 'NCC']